MAAPMNVLLISADQMRRDHMGPGGNPVIRTPHLDALAAGGVCLDRAYVNNPLCMPNRATIATGRLPRNHGAWSNGIDLPTCERTVADELAERGYHTALLGKGHLTAFGGDTDKDTPAYDCAKAWQSGRMTTDWAGPYYGFEQCRLSIGHGNWGAANAHYGAWLAENFPGVIETYREKSTPSPTGAPQCFTPDMPVEAHCSSWLGNIGTDYLRARADDGRPFLCWVSFPDPHHPFCPPRPYDTLHDPAEVVMPRFGAEALADKPPWYRRAHEGDGRWEGINPNDRLADITAPQMREIIARTYGMISLIDENIGRLLGALDATGLADNTVVIFTSDHGDLMGDCGLVFKGPFHLEGLINVPMIWRVPGGSAGMHGQGLFSSADIAPTILELLDVDRPRAMDGLAQADLVRGETGRRDAAFVEFKSFYRTELNLRTVVTADRKLTYYPGLDCGELYDMTADVPEARNLYDDPARAGERAELIQRLLTWDILSQDQRRWPLSHA